MPSLFLLPYRWQPNTEYLRFSRTCQMLIIDMSIAICPFTFFCASTETKMFKAENYCNGEIMLIPFVSSA